MASIESRIGELVAENRNLRQWLTEEAKSSKEDHDKLTSLEGELGVANEKIEQLERFKRGVEEADKKKLEEKIKETAEDGKEGRSRKFQIILEIIGALAAALVGGVAAKWLFK